MKITRRIRRKDCRFVNFWIEKKGFLAKLNKKLDTYLMKANKIIKTYFFLKKKIQQKFFIYWFLREE